MSHSYLFIFVDFNSDGCIELLMID